ncbi:hypothetical protein J4H86_21135 [Spiractinospora alimapuensis]|uniref:hypothetical protein n=1 Tax=Spiractinospora alimapuensis TaxID=2820884 RepID=UPI001F2DAC5A|nr:hypothetical protein [Spiractinospora alimapuensis]QVQ51299.1 hypothetical protein J4H86_21135 [Spiractinospora alimapuensis]
MALLSAEEIEAADDRQHRDEEVPEWGGTVRVVGLSGTDRDAYEAAMVDNKGKAASIRLANFRAKLVVKCLVDEEGRRLFGDDKAKVLGQKNGAVVDRLFDIARELSGMGKDAVAEGKENSGSDPSDASTSD